MEDKKILTQQEIALVAKRELEKNVKYLLTFISLKIMFT